MTPSKPSRSSEIDPPEGGPDADLLFFEGETEEGDPGRIGAVAREEDDTRRLQGEERGRPEVRAPSSVAALSRGYAAGPGVSEVTARATEDGDGAAF